MNRNHLFLFQSVAESGGFSRAAERLLISQPAVSLQVAELERSLGVPLFDRLPRGVQLTDAGKLLLGYASRITNLELEAERAVREIRGLERGRLVIGASLTVGSYVLPKILAEFSRRHPSIEVQMEIANTDEVQRRLVLGEFDVGLTEGFVESNELASEVFAQDELVAIAPPKHFLSLKPKVTARELCDQPCILREAGSGTRAVIERALAKRHLTIKPVMSLGSTEAIKAAVIAGVGVAIVSRLTIHHELKAKALVILRLSDVSFKRELHCVSLKGRSFSFAAREFVGKFLAKQQ